jgi:hypothetical protein
MPGKKKVKKKAAKPKAVKSGKGSSGKAKPTVAKTPPAAAMAKNVGTAPKAKPEGKAEPSRKEQAKAKPKTDLVPLRKQAEAGKAALEKAGKEADALRAKAKDVESNAKAAYVKAVAPYRDACRKAGVECAFSGGRATNVTPAVRFIVEKVKEGVKVMLTGKPETEHVIPFAALQESIGKAALAYTEKFIGPKEAIGNKQGSLGNRIRAVLAEK